MPRVVKKAAKKPVANGYKRAETIPTGEILTDINKCQWKIGKSIGAGGFGEIYSATSKLTESKFNDKDYTYVIKIEPHVNGPLFVEMHFYMRNAKKNDIHDWVIKNKLKHLGMPCYIGSGSHEYKNEKYRFLVMQRYGKDLWSLFLESKRILPINVVMRVGYQVLNVLEYIHSKGYVHADIKGANILLEQSSKTNYRVFLVDFGLAAHFTTKEFKIDPKKAHNGTIEYTSRDAHCGVLTRRGDLEILFYNLLQWCGNVLPWENNLTNPAGVQTEKELFFTKQVNLNTFNNIPGELVDIFKYIKSMKYDTVPDYKKLQTLFLNCIKNCGGTIANDSFNLNKSTDVIKQQTPLNKRSKKSIDTKSLDNSVSSPDIILPTPPSPQQQQQRRPLRKNVSKTRLASPMIPSTSVVTRLRKRVSRSEADLFDSFEEPSPSTDKYHPQNIQNESDSSSASSTPLNKNVTKRTRLVQKNTEKVSKWKNFPTIKNGLKQ